MKRTVLSILAACVAGAAVAQTNPPAAHGATGTGASGSSISVGILNSQRLALESAPGKEAQGRLKKLFDQKKEELDRLEKEARDLVEKLNTQGPSMPADKREALEKQADDKQKAWKRMQEDVQRDVDEAQRKEMGALESRLGPVVKDYFREKHFTLVLDSRAGIIYADDTTDVTDEVLKRINTTVALPQSKPPAEGSPTKTSPAPGAKPATPPIKPTPKKTP